MSARKVDNDLYRRLGGEWWNEDVGCGGGLLAEEFARLGLRVTGIDPSPESIETARAHASVPAGEGQDFLQGTGPAARFP